MNTSFLQGDDPEADLLGKATPTPAATSTAAPTAAAPEPSEPAAVASSRTARPSGSPTAAPSRPAQRPAPPPRPEKRWQRVNVYLEPKTQGHWLNRTRGRLLEHDRGDIGVTEIVRLALDRLAEQLNVSELVTEYDRRYGEQEGI